MNGQDQGITSPAHGKHVGKIVFAKNKSDIVFRNENPSNFSVEFSGKDNIYSRVYLSKSLANTSFGENKQYLPVVLLYNLFIDGKKVEHKRSLGMYRHLPADKKTYFTEEIDNNNQWSEWTSWRLFLLPEANDPDLKQKYVSIPARAFALALLDLEPGKHQVKIELSCLSMVGDAQTDVIAEGAFSITLTAADKKRLAFAYVPKLPENQWKGGNKEQLLAEIKEAFHKEIRKEPIVVGIHSINWNEGVYTMTGQKYRKISAWAIFPDGDGDGQVPITNFNWISDYSNGGGWTKLRFHSHCNGCPKWDVEVAAIKAMMSK